MVRGVSMETSEAACIGTNAVKGQAELMASFLVRTGTTRGAHLFQK